MNDVINIIQALEDSDILLEVISKTIKTETKEQKGAFLSMLLGTLSSTLIGNMLTGKGIVRAGYRNKKGEGIVGVVIILQLKKDLIPPHALTNFEIQKYYQNEPRYNGICSRDNLRKK